MIAPVIVAAGISALGSLFGSKKGQKSNPGAITYDPAAGMNPNELDPILQKLLNSADVSGQTRWNDTFGGLQDVYQSRGLGGSGIEFANEANAARQNMLENQALKDSYAMELYKLWMARRQQERDWAATVSNSYRTTGTDNGSSGFWQSLGQMAGGFLNADKTGTGGTTSTNAPSNMGDYPTTSTVSGMARVASSLPTNEVSRRTTALSGLLSPNVASAIPTVRQQRTGVSQFWR